ncbi:MAG TPA: vitamin K epoxide reductase family protein [Pyrinomonadaceae bacterium]|nr:vitamin K epoxide reductase family protein [Pyrinomonadaceae bacterium]
MKVLHSDTDEEPPAGVVGASGGTRRGALLDALAALVALAGLVDALYLTIEHLAGRSVRCVVTTGCDEVLSSSYATVAGGVPLAALGAVAYFTAFSLATLAAFGYKGARTLLLPLVALMFAAALWLLYVQAFVLQAFCAYCLLSAILTTTLALLVAARRFYGSKRRLT